MLNTNQNLWIIGEAGAGKTTLLQWIAVQYAKDYSERLIVPIYIELRNVNKKEFGIKSNIESIMKDSFFEGPTGWIENKIDTGKVIFLIDGCDEISTDNRELVFDRLEETDPECKCKKIYTSRPQIKEISNYLKKLPSDVERDFFRIWNEKK